METGVASSSLFYQRSNIKEKYIFDVRILTENAMPQTTIILSILFLPPSLFSSTQYCIENIQVLMRIHIMITDNMQISGTMH